MSSLPPRRAGPLSPIERETLTSLQRRANGSATVVDLQEHQNASERQFRVEARIAAFDREIELAIDSVAPEFGESRFLKLESGLPSVDRRQLRAHLHARCQKLRSLWLSFLSADYDPADMAANNPLSDQNLSTLNILVEMAAQQFAAEWNNKK
jgi:hypothetical protein